MELVNWESKERASYNGIKERLTSKQYEGGCIQKFPEWIDNEINNNNKHSLRSNTKGYGGKTH
jgi:hypothetical protein